jgi:hypothetical protein
MTSAKIYKCLNTMTTIIVVVMYGVMTVVVRETPMHLSSTMSTDISV